MESVYSRYLQPQREDRIECNAYYFLLSEWIARHLECPVDWKSRALAVISISWIIILFHSLPALNIYIITFHHFIITVIVALKLLRLACPYLWHNTSLIGRPFVWITQRWRSNCPLGRRQIKSLHQVLSALQIWARWRSGGDNADQEGASDAKQTPMQLRCGVDHPHEHIDLFVGITHVFVFKLLSM